MKISLLNFRSLYLRALLILSVIAIFFYAESSSAQQQGVPSDGKDFYIGFVYPSFNKNTGTQGRDYHGFFGVYALISSYEAANQVKVSYFDGSGNEIQSSVQIVGARNAVKVALQTNSMQMTEPGDKAEFKACHITSKKPVNVQYFSTGANSGGSYLAIPTPALGKSYVVASYNDNPGNGAFPVADSGEKAGGFLLIVAAFDSTKVRITPNGLSAGGHKRLIPYTVQLARGQCYWIKGDGSNELNDMSGSIVTSDKPIAVLGGHEDAFLGSVAGINVEARNFMIQQMIPVEDFESTGYVSMPMKDAPGTPADDAGFGENYRVFTADTNNVGVLGTDSLASTPMTTTAFWSPPRERMNVSTPTEFHSVDGKKFSVMMYDLRSQTTTGSPQTAEAMMSIVPMAHWRTSFLFYVPANTFEVLQNYYINVIAEKGDIEKGNIKYSFNGSLTLNPLSNLPNVSKYHNFPNHPELEGARYSVSPGAYYFTNVRTKIDSLVPIDTMLQGSFMVYHYGMRAIDPDRDLGDFCGDDFFFEYATPVGMSFSSGGGNPTAKVDTLCSSWHICVKDTGGVTIRSVTLLDDSAGNYYRPGKKFYNTHLDPTLDPDNKGEIDFSGNNSSECFDVVVSNSLDSAYAPLYIVDSKGTHFVLDLRYKSPRFRLSKLPELPLKLDSLVYPPTKIGQEVCSTLVYINTSPKGGKAFIANSISPITNDGSFKIASVIPKLPVTLQPGDSLKVNICFEVKDTLMHRDSLLLTTDCFKAPLLVLGKGGTPIIYATDIDFGNVIVGTTLCRPLTVENRGSLPYILSKDFLLHDTVHFALDPASAARLPIMIPPGGSVTFTFCYFPKQVDGLDSTLVDWKTDIAEPYTNLIKSSSHLQGKPINSLNVELATQSPIFSIRPNPTNGRAITLSYSLPAEGRVDFTIFDVLGREVYHEAGRIVNAGAHESEIVLPNLESGIYYARLTTGNSTATQKLEIVK